MAMQPEGLGGLSLEGVMILGIAFACAWRGWRVGRDDGVKGVSRIAEAFIEDRLVRERFRLAVMRQYDPKLYEIVTRVDEGEG